VENVRSRRVYGAMPSASQPTAHRKRWRSVDESNIRPFPFAAGCVATPPTDQVGAEGTFRAFDLRVFSAALFHLSYFGVMGLEFLAGVTRLERATSSFGDSRSSQLSYTPRQKRKTPLGGLPAGFHYVQTDSRWFTPPGESVHTYTSQRHRRAYIAR
jgi:hypothetical protein